MIPVVSRAAAQAYGLFPGLKDALPPEQIEAMESLDELFAALSALDETWPGRLVAEGTPMGWIGVVENPTDRFVETGEGLEVE